jgi:hypothetical protein
MSLSPPQPRSGDVVITRQVPASESPFYVVSDVDGVPHFRYDTREKALEHTAALARALHIDVWETTTTGNHAASALVVQCREVEVKATPRDGVRRHTALL